MGDIVKVIPTTELQDSFIVEDKVEVPYSTIKNEHGQVRQINDLSKGCKVSMGIERIMFSSMTLMDKEFGPNGEVVRELDNKDDRFRFVGGGWEWTGNVHGGYLNSSEVDDYMEITFYGTGLNLVHVINDGTRDLRVTLDDGSEGSNIYVVSDDILDTRNYKSNQIQNIVLGETLGWHTVKVSINHSSGIGCYGVEILNEASTLTINEGSINHKSSIKNISSQLTPAYNNDFESGTLGTNGGRVIGYIKQDGSFGKAVNPVGTPAYLTNTNHSNEEIIRRINWREFGANRSDDFSTMPTSGDNERAFTLDDGTTTLVCFDGRAITVGGYDTLANVGNTAFITLTFVGTGLDICRSVYMDISGHSIIIDGVSRGNLPEVTTDDIVSRVTLCSGLPYGTHTVKILRAAGSSGYIRITDFIIYGIKKPAIPESALEVCDYNIMADFIANTTADIDIMGIGILRSQNIRRATFSGTWSFAAIGPDIYTSGWYLCTTTNGGYLQDTFFGIGFDFRHQPNTSYSNSCLIEVDGLTLNTTNFPSLVANAYGGTSSFSTSTGILNMNGALVRGAGLTITGLDLGQHTVRITNQTTNALNFLALEIITPIHINNFKSGNQALLDSRPSILEKVQENKVDWTRAKAYLYYDLTTSMIHNSKNVSAVLDLGAGSARIYLKRGFTTNRYNVVGISHENHNCFLNTGNIINGNCEVFNDNFQIRLRTHAGALVDTAFSVVIYGELENEESINLEEL